MVDRVLNVRQLQTSVRCISVHLCYVRYILYQIADNDFRDCI